MLVVKLKCELSWLRYLFKDLGILIKSPKNLHHGNKIVLHIAVNPVFHKRTKHIEMNCHVVRVKIKLGQLVIRFTTSQTQVANIFIKALRNGSFLCTCLQVGHNQYPYSNLRGSVETCG